MADQERTLKRGPAQRSDKEFYKPYRIKPVEVYAEPNTGTCSVEKKS